MSDDRDALTREYVNLDESLRVATRRFIAIGVPTADQMAAQRLRVATIEARRQTLVARLLAGEQRAFRIDE